MPPMGDHACVTIPCVSSGCCTPRWVNYGWSSTWLIAGTTSASFSRASRGRGLEDAETGRRHLDAVVQVIFMRSPMNSVGWSRADDDLERFAGIHGAVTVGYTVEVDL